ncbi:hypothetical protein [Rickettsiella grylli]|uniref:Uncharacterized protein n=2 Tax=Rickettsiella grylli TaxID=59196 RepID=A8PMB5_9COXI|nr:hypothetical protein [Rickettsiella grylli]EDP45791.1 hypothetical protein RICGR_0679 [Rickettsiella grylli]
MSQFISFSNTIAELIKETLPQLEPFFETPNDENTFDLSQIKELKGHRTQLIQEGLNLIHQFDRLSQHHFFKNNKQEVEDYILKNTQLLLESLKNYSLSCNSSPQIKDFLNIIPDNISTIIGFTLIITSLLSIQFLPLVSIPLALGFWILIDFTFNNRKAAKQLKETMRTLKNELRTIEETHVILKHETTLPFPSETQRLSAAIPSTSQNYHSFSEPSTSSYSFFGTTDGNPDTEINLETSFSSTPHH